MTINSELWRVIATTSTQAQPLNTIIAKMVSITDIDTRARLLDKRDFLSWLRVVLASPGSLEFAVSESILGLIWDEIQTSAYYTPVLRTQEPPLVENPGTSGGDTLIANTAPSGYTRMVYSFNGLTFSQVDTLDNNPSPGVGNYVLVMVNDTTNDISLPSMFLNLTS